jgi:hypothetical protein
VAKKTVNLIAVATNEAPLKIDRGHDKETNQQSKQPVQKSLAKEIAGSSLQCRIQNNALNAAANGGAQARQNGAPWTPSLRHLSPAVP